MLWINGSRLPIHVWWGQSVFSVFYRSNGFVASHQHISCKYAWTRVITSFAHFPWLAKARAMQLFREVHATQVKYGTPVGQLEVLPLNWYLSWWKAIRPYTANAHHHLLQIGPLSSMCWLCASGPHEIRFSDGAMESRYMQKKMFGLHRPTTIMLLVRAMCNAEPRERKVLVMESLRVTQHTGKYTHRSVLYAKAMANVYILHLPTRLTISKRKKASSTQTHRHDSVVMKFYAHCSKWRCICA